MVHSGGSIFRCDGLPGIAAQIEIEYHQRWLSRCSVKAYAAIVVNRGAAASKISAFVFVRAPRCNPVARVTRMRWQFAPGNFLGMLVIDLTNPAFAGCHIARLCTGGISHRAIN